jgi:hypothetical protein
VEPNPASEWPGKRDELNAEETRDGGSTPRPGDGGGSSRRRRNLLTFAVFFVALCLVSGAVGFILYDRGTRKDRSTPTVVVFQYVDAIFDQRDPSEAELFECKDSTSRPALETLLGEIEEREQRFNIRISVSTGTNFNTSVEGTRATVVVDLVVAAPEANGERSRSTQSWQFNLRDEEGWRVCDARRAS